MEEEGNDTRDVAEAEEDLMTRTFGSLSERGAEVLMLAPMNHSHRKK